MPDTDERRSDDPQAELERLRGEVERLWSRDVARELKLSEAKYRALVEGSSDFIYVLDRDGCFTFANPEAENLLGYRPEEIIGRHFSEVLHPEDARSLGRAFHERRTGERATHRLEVRLRSRAGDTRDVELDIRHFSVSASGLYHDETFVGTHGVARDITERKYQETKRRALQGVREAVWSMARADEIKLVLESIAGSLAIMGLPRDGFGVYVLDMDEPPMLSLHGADGEGEMRRRGEWMISDAEPFARAVAAAWRRGSIACRRDIDTDGAAPTAAQIHDLFPGAHTVVDVPFSHGVLTVTGAGRASFSGRELSFLAELAEVLSEGFRRMGDLRELTLSEKRYRTLVETPNLVVMLMDSQRNFLYVSPQIERWLGYGPEEFYRDPRILERIVEAEDLETINAAVGSGREPVLRDVEFRWRSRAGTHQWASVSLFPVYESAEDEQVNRVSMVQAVIQDITERKHGEALIQSSLAEKEVLLKEIHHRVKNNLQIISSLLHLQSSDLEEGPARAIFNDSQNRINSMALIHEELYNAGDLARVDFATYVRTLVENLFESYGVPPGQIGMSIDVEAQPLNLDRAIPLGLIINELVSNSLKYAFPGGRRGQVTVSLRVPGSGRFALRVADDGVGFPEDVDHRRPRSLGLRLVDTLANQLHAHVELERGVGTTFRIAHA